MNGPLNMNGTPEVMTEKVDKTLIERLIIERSERLELEINHKARADAWKFYYRVRVDHVVRPFAVCKVCFRVLHCDSRSGTASLLRHPCNPLSERSPVNRAVRLTAKLNLPTDGGLKGSNGALDNKNKVVSVKSEPFLYDGNNSPNTRVSPNAGVFTNPTSCPSPTSTGSPPTAAQPALTAALNLQANIHNNNNINHKKRKAVAQPTSPNFPLDLRFLQIPQLMAAAAVHPFSALTLANAGLINDPQQLQQFQQQLQQTQLQHILREHQKQQQINQQKADEQEREIKRTKGGTPNRFDEAINSSPESSGSNYTLEALKIKSEKPDSSELLASYLEEARSSPLYGKHVKSEDPGGGGGGRYMNEPGLTKEVVQQLVSSGSPRILLTQKETGSHYISDVWNRFSVVYVDGQLRPFAACKSCHKVVTYTKYSGTGGLLRHRCAVDPIINLSRQIQTENGVDSRTKVEPLPPPPYSSRDNVSPLTLRQSSPFPQLNDIPFNIPIIQSPISLIKKEDIHSNHINHDSRNSSNPMAEMSKALLKYMCNDMVPSHSMDTPAFQQLMSSVLKLGAIHGPMNSKNILPSTKQLLDNFLQPLVQDSKCSIAKDVQDLTHLGLSLYKRASENNRDINTPDLLAVALHYITSDFKLKNHALGTHVMYPSDSLDHVIDNLLTDFFQEVLPASNVREKHVTVVRDRCTLETDSAKVTCVWHSVEGILDELKETEFYSTLCRNVLPIIKKLPNSSPNTSLETIQKWDELLFVLTNIVDNYEQLQNMLQSTSPSEDKPVEAEFELDAKQNYDEIVELLQVIQQCLQSVRDSRNPTLNQTVLCRAKLLQICSERSDSTVGQQIKEFLINRLHDVLVPEPLQLVASFLDPRCKSLKVLNETEKQEVHKLVMEMMTAVSITEANTGVLNLKTRRNSTSDDNNSPNSVHPFREYMDNNNHNGDASVSDTEEILAYVNMKVSLDNDDILSWWSGPSAAGLPTLRRLARKILAVPATCAYAHQLGEHAVTASQNMGLSNDTHINQILHMKYNIA